MDVEPHEHDRKHGSQAVFNEMQRRFKHAHAPPPCLRHYRLACAAGTAMGAPKSEINRGWASGFGVRLLDELVRSHYETRG